MKKLLFVSLVLLLAAPVFAAGPDPELPSDIMIHNHAGELVPGVRCATVDRGNPDLARAPYDLQAWARQNGNREKAIVTVDIAFHVLYYYSNRYGAYIGDVSDQMIADQVAVLNAAYLPDGFQFNLVAVDRTENKQWATMRPGSGFEQACKAALAIDPAHTLNVYTAYPTGGLLGWSYFPWSFEETNTMHGSVIHYGSLPGGFADPYNEGDTATHEIGHYLGLYHTFQGGCSEPNDYCDDTPQEQTATFRCPDGQDSCPDDPGLDPIYNFMDYTDDYCMDHFTGDQALRMEWAVTTYRPSLLAAKALPEADLIAASGTRIQSVSPNPFNPKAEIRFYLERSGHVNVGVYDIAGRLVRTLIDRSMDAGEQRVMFDGTGLPSAAYFMKLESDDVQLTERLMLIK